MKAIHFGAGNIGRGFIAWLLVKSGYDVVFIDVNENLVNAINDQCHYAVILANDEQTQEEVTNVSAILGTNRDAVVQAIRDAELVTTAIGVNALRYISGTLAAAIRERMKEGLPQLPVIACENAISASHTLRELVCKELTDEEQQRLDRYAVFPDAAVDRIVPMQNQSEGLDVLVEPYSEWIVESSVLDPERRPQIVGLKYVESLEPYISRKLFTVNTGHCSAAYLGYLRNHTLIQEVMADAELREKVRQVMLETGHYLIAEYGFARHEHEAYIEQILTRFANPHLRDDVLRIGRSPIRKLSPGDRLVKPVMLAHERGLPVHHLLDVIAAALRFDPPSDEEAVQLQEAIHRQGVSSVVEQYLGIPKHHDLHGEIVRRYDHQGGYA
jgi:mannitol-1-phosphate 5-dehydrogenase